MIKTKKINQEMINLIVIFVAFTTILNIGVLTMNDTINRDSSQKKLTNIEVFPSNRVKNSPVQSAIGVKSLKITSKTKKDSLESNSDTTVIDSYSSTTYTNQVSTSNVQGNGISDSGSSTNVITNTLPSSTNSIQATYTTSGPISINGNTALANAAQSGSGTAASPYTFQNLNITASSGDAVYIQNVDAYFILNSNIITGTASSGAVGIHLYNATHGMIYNNKIRGFTNNILLDTSKLNSVINNDCNYPLGYCVNVFHSNNNTISYNNQSMAYSSDGIVIDTSNFNIIDSNTINTTGRGIWDNFGTYNTYTNNILNWSGTISGYGFYIQASNDTVTGNQVSNFRSGGIYDYVGSYNYYSNNIVTKTQLGFYGEASAHDLISHNTFNQNSYGIYLYLGATYNTIQYNTVNQNYADGIYLYGSNNNNLISGNDFSNSTSGYGIFDYQGSLNTFYNNTANYCVGGFGFSSTVSDTISNNTANFVTTSTASGFYMTGTTSANNVTFNDNFAIGNYYGFYIETNGTFTFKNNYASSNTKGNIYIYEFGTASTPTASFVNNTALGNGITQTGVYSHIFSTNMSANTIYGDTLVDVDCDYAYYSNVSYNTIGSNGYSPGIAFNLTFAQYSNIINNSISSSTNGFKLYSVTHNLFANNSINSASIPINQADSNSTYNEFYTNTISSYTTNSGSVILDSPITGTTYANSVTLTYDINLPASSNTLSIITDNVANSSALLSGSVLSTFSIGTHNIVLLDTDSNNNVYTQKAIFSVIDTLAPAISITTPLNTTYYSQVLTMTYSVTDLNLNSITIYEDGNLVPTYSSGTQRTFSNGTHSFTVVGLDTSGNSATVTVYFSIDLFSLSINNSINNTLISTGTIDYSAFGYTSISIYIDNVKNTSSIYNPGFTLAGLPDGSHNITIAVSNSTLNMMIVKYLYFTLDATSPSISITSPFNNSYYNSNNVLFSYSVSDVHLSQVIIYQNGVANYSVLVSGTQLNFADGYYNITIYAVDSAGNSNSYSVFFTVDTTNPTITINSPTNTTYGLTSVTMTYLVTDINYYNTTLYEDGVQVPTYLTGTVRTFANGVHNFTVVGLDKAGNMAIKSVIFTVDTTIPSLTFSNPANNSYINSNSVTVDYSASNYNTIEVFVDGTQNTTSIYNSGFSLTGLNDGLHNVTIKLIKTDTNKVVVESLLFTVDTTNPTVSITSPTATGYNTGSITLTYSANDAHLSSVIIYLNDVANNSAEQSGFQLNFAGGNYNITVVAIDLAGNSQSQTVLFYVDTINPTVTITSPTAIGYNTGSITLTYSASDIHLSSVVIYLNNVANTSAESSGTILNLADGNYNISIYVVDGAGNSQTATVLFYVDTTSPTLIVTNPTNTTYTTNSVTLTYAATDTHLSSVIIYINGKANTTVITSGNSLSLVNGYYNLTLYAVDSLGNAKSISVFFTVNKPTTTPPVNSTTNPVTSTPPTTSNPVTTTTNNSGSSSTSKKGGSSPGFEVVGLLFSMFIVVPVYLRRRRKE